MNSKLQKLKNTYKKIQLSDKEVDKGWLVLVNRLPEQDSPATNGRFIYRYAFLIGGILIFILITAVQIAQADTPNNPLYAVRQLSNKVISTVFHVPQILPVTGNTRIITPSPSDTVQKDSEATDESKITGVDSENKHEEKNQLKQKNEQVNEDPSQNTDTTNTQGEATFPNKANSTVKGISTSSEADQKSVSGEHANSDHANQNALDHSNNTLNASSSQTSESSNKSKEK